MSIGHDQPSGPPAPASEMPAPLPLEMGDPLSDVLRTVRLRGALFFMIHATSPWCVAVPDVTEFAHIVLPSAGHVVSYHIVLEGRGLASTPGSGEFTFGTGDVIVFPTAIRI